MNRSEYEGAMAVVCAVWPHWKATERTFTAGWVLLQDLEADVVEAAILALAVETPEFAPGLGAIRARAVNLLNPVPDADEAWAEVMEQVRRVGRYRPEDATWSHPAVAAAVASMGWQDLCNSTNPVADRAHFGKFYEAARTRTNQAQILPGPVTSLLERVASQLALSTGGESGGDPDRDPGNRDRAEHPASGTPGTVLPYPSQGRQRSGQGDGAVASPPARHRTSDRTGPLPGPRGPRLLEPVATGVDSGPTPEVGSES